MYHLEGIHAFGWSTEEAVEYMVENSAMTRESIEKEVNRYITLPGQACTYKIGEFKILELRTKSENALGDEFDFIEFHKTLLHCPGPLNVVESCVDKWIEEKYFEHYYESGDDIDETVSDKIQQK